MKEKKYVPSPNSKVGNECSFAHTCLSAPSPASVFNTVKYRMFQ